MPQVGRGRIRKDVIDCLYACIKFFHSSRHAIMNHIPATLQKIMTSWCLTQGDTLHDYNVVFHYYLITICMLVKFNWKNIIIN